MMLKEKLMEDYKEAVKSGNVTTKQTVQMIRAAIKQTEIDKQVELDDDGIMEIISKQVKQKQDALEQFEKAGREDLVNQTRDEINVCKKYLPEMVEISEIAVKAMEFKVAKDYGNKDMGKLIKDLKEFYGVRANGKDIANAAKVVLGNG